MRTIKISDDVWIAIAERGKFGETENDVLQRIFELNPEPEESEPEKIYSRRTRHNFSTDRMSPVVKNDKFTVTFQSGPSRTWDLPRKYDKDAIRLVLDMAMDFALKNGATIGQRNAVRKALTDNGYHLTK